MGRLLHYMSVTGEQLAFHDDIDNSEPVEFLAQAVSEDEIKSFLIEKATDIF